MNEERRKERRREEEEREREKEEREKVGKKRELLNAIFSKFKKTESSAVRNFHNGNYGYSCYNF